MPRKKKEPPSTLATATIPVALLRPGERAVVVTTEHRGVFFGYATDTNGRTITLRRGRLAVYWGSAMHGFLGLATYGPDKDCRISPAADITLRNITSVVEATPDAVAAWEAEPWAKTEE